MSDSHSPSAVSRQLDNCSYCPKMCRHACPVSNADGREPHTPQSKMDRLNQLRKGHADWTAENTDSLWACTGCRQCTTYCNHGNEPGLVLLAGRAEAHARGLGHPGLEDYPDRFRNRERRLAGVLRDTVPAESRSSDAVVGFWPGCDMVDKSAGDIDAALDVFRLMDAEHVRVVDSDQVCGGYPLLAAGFPDMFRWHATRVAEELKSFDTVVVNCSACLHSMRAGYAAEGVHLAPKVLALAEYLAQAVTKLPVPADKSIVYYHDPCYLARYEGVLEEPRRVLGRIADLRDFHYSHTDTECCGGGGVLPKTMPSTADEMARRRLRDIASRGGGDVVTSCGTCSFMLRSNAPESVDVYDLPGYLKKVLGEATIQRP